MSFEKWIPEGKTEEITLTTSDGKTVEHFFHPYKMFNLDVFNQGPNTAKIMVNDQSLPLASTLTINRGRPFKAEHPAFWRIAIYANTGESITVKVTATR